MTDESNIRIWRETSADILADLRSRPRRSNPFACRCPDMQDVPGRCHGPENCPLQEGDDE